MRLLFTILLLLGFLQSLVATDCEAPRLQKQYSAVRQYIITQEALKALNLADTLLLTMEAEKLNACQLYLWVLFQKAESLELLGDGSEEALQIYYDLIRRGKEMANWNLVAHTKISVARVHETIGRPVDCLRYLKKARQIIDEHGLEAVFARYAVRYSSYHRIYDNRDTAKVYARLAVEYGAKAAAKYNARYDDKRSELDGHLLLGILAEDVEESVFHMQKATDLCLSRNNFDGASIFKSNIARSYLEVERYDEASKHLDTAAQYLQLLPKSNISEYQIAAIITEYRSRIFEQQGQLDSALHYLKESNRARRMYDIEINHREINKQETLFAIETEREKLVFEKSKSQLLTRSLVVGSLLMLALFILYVNNVWKQRRIANQKDLIDEQNRQLKESVKHQSVLLTEIHHRVKNNLQLVMSLLTLHGSKTAEPNVKIQFEDMSNKVRSIALMHEQLYRSGEFQIINLEDYFSELITYFEALQNVSGGLEIRFNARGFSFNLETVLPLGIICTELISNSIKYARLPDQSLQINLVVAPHNRQYQLSYTDNGPGYPDGQLVASPTSLGTMLINSMVRQLNATCETASDNGAKFTMIFDEKKLSVV